MVALSMTLPDGLRNHCTAIKRTMLIAQEAGTTARMSPAHLPGRSCRVRSLCLHAVHQIRHDTREGRDPDARTHQQQHLELLGVSGAGSGPILIRSRDRIKLQSQG